MSARKHTLDSDEDDPTPTKCQFTDHQTQLEEHGKKRGPEVMKMMDEEAVRIMLSQGCCQKNCLGQFPDEEVIDFRSPLFDMTREKRRVYHASNASVRAHAWRRNAHDELWIRGP